MGSDVLLTRSFLVWSAPNQNISNLALLPWTFPERLFNCRQVSHLGRGQELSAGHVVRLEVRLTLLNLSQIF